MRPILPEIPLENTPCPACGHAHSDPSQLTFDYMSESGRTCSPTFYGERIPLASFIRRANAAVVMLQALDDIKKVAFYGRNFPHVAITKDDASYRPMSPNPSLMVLRDKLANEHDLQRATDIIHAILGKATEAGELLSILVDIAVNNDDKFDSVNALEEIGDGLWYDALLLRALDSDFDTAMQLNIKKLRARFPNAFTEDEANNRNLDNERKALEG